jgi:hypothetical protein
MTDIDGKNEYKPSEGRKVLLGEIRPEKKCDGNKGCRKKRRG